MLKKAIGWLHRKTAPELDPETEEEPEPLDSIFSTDHLPRRRGRSLGDERVRRLRPIELQLPASKFTEISQDGDTPGATKEMTFDEAIAPHAMDSTTLKQAFTLGQGAIPDILFNWFSQQNFIGYQACAIISQHWLVENALAIPAKDAMRNGYEIVSDDGEELDVERLSKLRKADERFKIDENLIEFETNKRRFGFRIAIFVVESDDKDYYKNPFNIDGVTPGSYKGITQVDPSWVAPILDQKSSANPAAMDFYEPTWWQISGQMYHKSHIVISRYINPPDILKPSYQYGGIPLTQLILERVYAAERTANEAPMLVQTKRLNVIHTDLATVMADPAGLEERLQVFNDFRDNYGTRVVGTDDQVEQFDTSLTDLTAVIDGQYNLVASVAGMPATKLMGRSPSGMDATGEFEMKSYHELLENIQMSASPLLARHHELLIKSELQGGPVRAVWNPVSTPSPKELAEINNLKSQVDSLLQNTGAIDAIDVRDRLISDPHSGYAGIQAWKRSPEERDEDEDDDFDAWPPPEPVLEAEEAAKAKEIEASRPDSEESETDEDKEETGTDSNILGYVNITPMAEVGTELGDWTRRAGIENGVNAAEFHVTLAHSITDLNPEYAAPSGKWYLLEFTGEIEILGVDDDHGGALVLRVESPELRKRYAELQKQGSESKYPDFKPHITIKYDPSPGDLERARAAFEANPLEPIAMGNEIRNLT